MNTQSKFASLALLATIVSLALTLNIPAMAESDAIRAAAAWSIALVKLRQAQGLLPAECGFALPPACCR